MPSAAASACLSPAALAASPDAKSLYIACATADTVAIFDTHSGSITASIPVPAAATGLALSPDGARLYVTCAAPQSQVCVLDPATRKVVGTLAAGHTAMAPILTRNGRTLYVCNRFNHDISVFDLPHKKEARRISVQREPVAADLTKDEKYLLVANHLSRRTPKASCSLSRPRPR